MSKRVALCSAALVLVCAAGVTNVRAEHRGRTLVVTMTNDPIENRINVYDADTHTLLQSLSTHGKGGAGGNARGVKQFDGELVAAVNNGSNTVAVFRRDGDILKFDKVVSTTQRAGERGFRKRPHVCRGRDHRRLVRAASEHGGVARWHERTGTGRRRRSSQRQHGAGRGDQRQAIARHAEDRSGSGHRRSRVARRRPRDRSGSHGSLRTPGHPDAVRLCRLPRRDGRHHPGTLQSGRSIPQRRVYVGGGRRPGG